MAEVSASKPRNLAEGVRIGLDEMFQALEESIAGLSTEQVWSHPIAGPLHWPRHCIAVLVLHMQQNIDRHACQLQVGSLALSHEERFFAFYGKPVEEFTNLTGGPDVEELRQRTQRLREAVMAGLEGADDRTLYGPRHAEQTPWWQQHRRVSIDAYHRVIWHANGHIRQIWCLRGAMGAFDREHYPRQHWH